ncbi:ligand-binding sensor domain-containing protein [Polaribacter glomeratus]|uniref:Uncharacterized protein n=1 Tax=Polaribacter glomeratus TaxID=102 RepID=A0A2S7WIR3_9FLAO|nr:hypothetical protein [Polaribacter glomeratus]PQJ77326.1 hypothetical protein BTO16_15935 [Polaribacter glomeratus]TXD65910.1 hypothetical protein ESX12_07045 [Polaribacter glomeratus]
MEKGILFIDCNNYKATYKSFKEMVGVENAMYVRTKSLKNEFQVSIPGHLMVFDYNLKLKKAYSFLDHLSRASYKDSRGNIWLIDFMNGVSLLPNPQLQTKYYQKNNKIQKINSIDGRLYLGINEKGFYKFDKLTNEFMLIHKFTKKDNAIYQIKKDSLANKNFFIVNDFSYSIKKSNFEEFKIKNTNYLNDNSANYFISSFKDITSYKGANYIVTTSRLLKSENQLKGAKVITNKSGLLLAKVFKDELYVAGSDGLNKLENETLIKPKIKNDLLHVSICSITSINNFLIIGTDGRGVYLYDEKEVIHLKNTDGFSIQKILKKENNLWIATQKGVHQITLNNADLQNSKLTNSFYDTDGLVQNNTNDIYIENDTLFAASDAGLAKININNSIYKQQPRLSFKSKKIL